MKTLARAFIDLASYVQLADFADPDEAQGAQETISLCLSSATAEERALLFEVTNERIAELESVGAATDSVGFFRILLTRIKQQFEEHDT